MGCGAGGGGGGGGVLPAFSIGIVDSSINTARNTAVNFFMGSLPFVVFWGI